MMKKMKRACALLLSMAMLMALAACGGEKATTPPESGSTPLMLLKKLTAHLRILSWVPPVPVERGMSLAAVLQIL